jgi:hypothetical protein
MAMSKQDFIALADSIREFNRTAFWGTDKNGVQGTGNAPLQGDALKMLADFCQRQSGPGGFKRQRWMDYIAGECGPNGGPRGEAKL